MNEITISTPYDIIIQQQIDIIASRQKDILEGKEGVSNNDLHIAIAQLQNIKACTPIDLPSFPFSGYSGIAGGIGSAPRFKDLADI